MRLAKRKMWEARLLWMAKMRAFEFQNGLKARMAGFVGQPDKNWRKDIAKRARKSRYFGDKAR